MIERVHQFLEMNDADTPFLTRRATRGSHPPQMPPHIAVHRRVPLPRTQHVDELSELVAETEPAVVVDGLLGTGLKEKYVNRSDSLKVINVCTCLLSPIDIPSGLTAIRAKSTACASAWT